MMRKNRIKARNGNFECTETLALCSRILGCSFVEVDEVEREKLVFAAVAIATFPPNSTTSTVELRCGKTLLHEQAGAIRI
jgi:hypothetical protein